MKRILIVFIALTVSPFILTSCGSKDKDPGATKNLPVAAMTATPGVTALPINGFATKPAVGTKSWCPVMKNAFTVEKNTTFSVYKGKYYAFCCPGCKPAFDKEPEKYISLIAAYKK